MKTSLLVILCSLMNMYSAYLRSYEILLVSRFLSGIYCGIFMGILPMYLNELPPQNLRGSLGTLNQLSIVFGILVSNILGLPDMLGNQRLWPVLVSLTLIPACLQLVGLMFAVESPKFLFHNKSCEDAVKGMTT